MMEQELEIELKNLVTREEFEKLISHFSIPKDQFKSQTNHYFDTSDFALKKHGCALRIRKKGNTYTFTLKEPQGDGLLESNERLSEKDAELLINGEGIETSELLDHLQEKYQIQPTDLYSLGSLETNRHEESYRSGLLVFDHSKYLGIEDFELEFEVPDRKQGEDEFNVLLSEFNIPKRQTPNKIQRFFDRKNK
ncbi:CYTH domain-containing protein [Pseudalkalibacillus sp. Hm43]|uniref:CYTH domain-containing protein n=1 Tax=Pseudalkalibacillus sp. Hm43 TaxID=3450742 RepID=UPI003F43AE70